MVEYQFCIQCQIAYYKHNNLCRQSCQSLVYASWRPLNLCFNEKEQFMQPSQNSQYQSSAWFFFHQIQHVFFIPKKCYFTYVYIFYTFRGRRNSKFGEIETSDENNFFRIQILGTQPQGELMERDRERVIKGYYIGIINVAKYC